MRERAASLERARARPATATLVPGCLASSPARCPYHDGLAGLAVDGALLAGQGLCGGGDGGGGGRV